MAEGSSLIKILHYVQKDTNMDMNKKLTITNLTKTFKKLDVLKNVSLYVGEGELVSIVGPSGCGKSTLLDCVAGLESYQGEIIGGQAAYMLQDDTLLPWRRVIDNVILPLEIAGIKKDMAKKQARKLLSVFGLEKFERYYPFMLSGGMRQRAALLRTYLGKKDLLLLDEPFARLDAITRRKMQEWFLSIWQKHKKSVLFVTHDVDEAVLLSNRVYVMSGRPGRIIKDIAIDIKGTKTKTELAPKKINKYKKEILTALNLARSPQ